MPRVLVTGNLGYIGSRLTSYLAERGFECRGLDAGFFQSCLLYPETPSPTTLKDMRDLAEADLDGINAVVHLAGISNDPVGDLAPASIYDPTREYARVLAVMCKRRGIRFVFASSCSVYGRGADGLMDETAEPSPLTGYSLNKLQVERDLAALADNTFSPVALRFATIFGLSPRIRFDVVVNMFVGMAVTTGEIVLNSDGLAWRPHLHIEDACEAIARALELDAHTGGLLVVNVGDDAQNHQVLDIANIVSRAVPGCEVKFLRQLDSETAGEMALVRDRKIAGDVDARTYRVSFDRLPRVFPGFKCRWSVRAGVEAMRDRFRAEGLTQDAFRSTAFYRLQRMEEHVASGRLDRDLRWTSPVAGRA